jgi:hypothetical protein
MAEYYNPTDVTGGEFLSIWKHTSFLPTKTDMLFFNKKANKKWGFREGFLIDDDDMVHYFKVPL